MPRSVVTSSAAAGASQMIERYRRRARSLAEANLRQRDLLPLDLAIPEFNPLGGERAAPPQARVSRVE